MSYICWKEAGHHEIIDNLGNWEYIQDNVKTEKVETIIEALKKAEAFIYAHPNSRFHIEDGWHNTFLVINDDVNEPGKVTYTFSIKADLDS